MTESNENEDSVDWSSLEDALDAAEKMGFSADKVVTTAMLQRRMVWDITPCPEVAKVSDALGLNPVSPDVLETEHQDHHRRMVAAQDVAPVVAMLSDFAMDAFSTGMIEIHGESLVRPETMEAISALVKQVSYVILAELVDLDIVHTAHYGLGQA